MSNRNLRDEYIKRLHRSVEEMLRYTDIASCDKVVMTKEQLKRFENDTQQLKLPASYFQGIGEPQEEENGTKY